MVKNLYLIRHGKAEEQGSGTKDFERHLTSIGYQDSSRIGLYLKKQKVHPDIIVHSNAVRATETAERINEQLGIDPDHVEASEDIYEASVRTLIKRICEIPAEMRSALVVGHNPSLTFMAEYITGSEIGHVVPGGIVHIRVPYTSWAEISEKNCDFVGYISPKEFK